MNEEWRERAIGLLVGLGLGLGVLKVITMSKNGMSNKQVEIVSFLCVAGCGVLGFSKGKQITEKIKSILPQK